MSSLLQKSTLKPEEPKNRRFALWRCQDPFVNILNIQAFIETHLSWQETKNWFLEVPLRQNKSPLTVR
jgi:hypothetical protein